MNLLTETTSIKPLQWKKLFLSTLLSGVTMWIVAGLWHTIIAIHYYKNETDAEHEGIGIIAIAIELQKENNIGGNILWRNYWSVVGVPTRTCYGWST